MFYRYFFRVGITVSIIIMIFLGIICYQNNLNPISFIFPDEITKDSYHIIPVSIESSDCLSAFDRVIVDGDNKVVRELYERVSNETQKLPDLFIDIFNNAGFKLIITDNIHKYTKQNISPGFYLGGVTQIHVNDRRVVLFPVQGDHTSLYHELGHVIVSAYHMEKKTLPGIWKYDKDGAIQLTGEYTGTSPHEVWAEVFEYLMLNMNDTEKMANAEQLIPVSYKVFERLLEYEEAAA